MYIDIHVHNEYYQEGAVLLRNIFPEKIHEVSRPGYYSIGLHPWYVEKDLLDEIINKLEGMAKNQNVLAIGEIGLDTKVDVPVELQLKAFKMQLFIAEKVKKPVIIHCVKAYNELLSLRKRSDQDIPWIFHWYNSGIEMAKDLISKNCYLSFGISLFKNESKAFKAFKDLPSDRIFFETDDVGIKIAQVYERAALILNISVEDLKKQILKNFKVCFQRDLGCP